MERAMMALSDGATRRQLLGGAATTAALLGIGPAQATAAGQGTAATDDDRVAQDLERYLAFGDKASGGPGDRACGAWVEGALRASGYHAERQAFDAPFFEATRAELSTVDARVPVVPQAIVVPTGAAGVSGRLVRVDPRVPVTRDLTACIALVDLPHARWSSLLARPIVATLATVHAAGAVAAVLVPNGPTGKAITLNAKADKPMFGRPLATLAPDAAGPWFAAAEQGATATLTIEGRGGSRAAFNVAGRLDRGAAQWLVLSTPRSGWYACAGERGPGIAAWMELARWAARTLTGVNLLTLCNSGHEYEYLGAEHALRLVPPPTKTRLWFHFGAAVAARDWHELGGGRLLALSSVDPQRYLMASAPLVPAARTAFAGLPGLEAAYPANGNAAGELANIVAAGYAAAGIVGAHRYHHTVEDDVRCVDPALVRPVIAATKRFLSAALA